MKKIFFLTVFGKCINCKSATIDFQERMNGIGYCCDYSEL